MKKLIIAGALVLLPFGFAHAAVDYFLKLGGVEGETTKVIKLETQSGVVGQAFILDGTQSQDDGTITRFLWKQISGPTVKLSSTTVVKPSFTPTQAGTYVFELTVTDAAGKSSTAQRSEVAVSASSHTGTVAAPTPKPQEGNVEYEWKVEEGESAAAPSIEPDEIDVADDGEPLTPDFGILLGGGSSDEEEEARAQIADILLKGAQEEGAPVEQVSLNFEKIKVKTKHQLKLFGFIPISTSATVEIDAHGDAYVRFPWWSFLASGKDTQRVGEETLETMTSVLAKNKAETDGLLLIRTL